MDPARQGEIALTLIKALVRHGGMEKLQERLLQLSKVSAATGISVEELEIFSELILHELVKDYFVEITAK